MRFAIIRVGGMQFRVQEGHTFRVSGFTGSPGEAIDVETMAVSDDGALSVGAPTLKDVSVLARVVDYQRDRKIIVFKKKRRKQYKRKQGHRQDQTTIRIESVG